MTLQDVRAGFADSFGAPPELVVRSPGRVNLIGEHTDYNDGFALPAALDRGTDVAARARPDGVLRTLAGSTGDTDERPTGDLRPQTGPTWSRYVAGAAAMLGEHGIPLPGADLFLDSDLPIGAGLSSSASLELGVMVALAGLAGAVVGGAELARLGQRVENEIIGVQSGIMDQLAIACAEPGQAILIDCRSLGTDPVAIPSGVRILVLDSAVPRSLAGSAYNQRRAECESALARLREVDASLQALRDVPLELLEEQRSRLADVEFRRARHVITENARTLAGADALRAGDAAQFGQLMVGSHVSLREDYEVSGPELDALVDIATATPGVLGARLTGAGFGGSVVALVTADGAGPAADVIVERYRAQTGRPGSALVTRPSGRTQVVWQA